MDTKPMSDGHDLLIVGDLMLLLMDDDGASIQGAGALYTSTTVTRASEIARGHWGPEAVAATVTRTAAVVAASAASVGR